MWRDKALQALDGLGQNLNSDALWGICTPTLRFPTQRSQARLDVRLDRGLAWALCTFCWNPAFGVDRSFSLSKSLTTKHSVETSEQKTLWPF